MVGPKKTDLFEAERPRLMGLAYRILGSRADAEDAVQDTFVKWARVDPGTVETPAAWLTTVCTRRCLDLLRGAHRARVDYVGAWLPEPIQVSTDQSRDDPLDLASSLTTAFLLVLERLTPKARAAYLLHEIFDRPYPEIAETLGMNETACRKLVSRARDQVSSAKVRHTTPPERQEELLAAFQAAVTEGTTGPLAGLLAQDVRLTTDSGGKVAALRDPLVGKHEVLDFLTGKIPVYWAGYTRRPSVINGTLGLVVELTDETSAAVSFAFDEAGQVTDIFIMRNPEKLHDLSTIAIV